MSFEDDLRATLEAGRDLTARALRSLADEVGRLPVDDTAATLAWLASQAERIWREAGTIFGGQPRRS